MFALTNEWYRQRRRLQPEQEPQVSKRLGQVPPLAQLQSTSARVSWGVELGARYRDAIRAAGDAGAKVDAWQLDEIVPSAAAAAAGIPIRELTRGVVRGVAIGRPIDRTAHPRRCGDARFCLGRAIGLWNRPPRDYS
jgi:hypothetical protein